ncbi:hypothetical protein EVAR_28654_1 [Eumeta japonica]|uniref:Uncharacterized protein n=1 Tax=Eumeta variegata TaxID=151549 RepID=A0A4C2ACB5_EUMVA|nr:hypothetical protein EVAR_28654_1 [Eumeta japonica]
MLHFPGSVTSNKRSFLRTYVPAVWQIIYLIFYFDTNIFAGFLQVETVIVSPIVIENGTRSKIRAETGTEIENGTEVETGCGAGITIKIVSGFENREITGARIDSKEESLIAKFTEKMKGHILHVYEGEATWAVLVPI